MYYSHICPGTRGRAGIGMTYWEGAVTVHGPDGLRAGEGYVELTGYGENNRPPIWP